MKSIITRIIGNIGAGKSTLLEQIKNKFDGVLYEPVIDNPILDLFYVNQKEWAFVTQCYFERKYWHLLMGLYSSARKNIVTDYNLTSVFTATLKEFNFLTAFEYVALDSLFKDYLTYYRNHFEVKYIYIPTSPDECFQRIKDRGRLCEKEISLKYLCMLDEKYKEFCADLPKESLTIAKKERI